MLPITANIKKTARTILSREYFSNIVSTLSLLISSSVIMLILSLLSGYFIPMVAVIFKIITSLFVIMPLFLGILRRFSRIIDGTDDSPVTVFYYFSNIKNYISAVKFVLYLSFRLFLSGLILSIPSLIAGFFAKPYFYDLLKKPIPLWSPIFSTISGLLMIMAILVFIIVNLKYYLSLYIFVISEGIKPNKALKQSSVIARRTQSEFIYLLLSMLGYIVLSVFYIPLVFILPFMITVYAIHSKCAVVQYNYTIDTLAQI